MRPLRALFFIACLSAVTGIGCRDDPDSSQQSAQRAWQLAERAQDEARQAARLRDIDRARCDREKSELSGEQSSLKGLAFLLVLFVIVALCWLGLEVRRRKTWVHVAHKVAGVAQSERTDLPSDRNRPRRS